MALRCRQAFLNKLNCLMQSKAVKYGLKGKTKGENEIFFGETFFFLEVLKREGCPL